MNTISLFTIFISNTHLYFLLWLFHFVGFRDFFFIFLHYFLSQLRKASLGFASHCDFCWAKLRCTDESWFTHWKGKSMRAFCVPFVEHYICLPSSSPVLFAALVSFVVVTTATTLTLIQFYCSGICTALQDSKQGRWSKSIEHFMYCPLKS